MVPGADDIALAEKLHLTDRVLFRGALPTDAVGSVLRCGHVLVLPSRFDGWGVVVNEGAAAGLALIATDRVGAAYHILEPGLNGFRVRAGSRASLAAAMRAYARDPALAIEHGLNARSRFQQFTPDAGAAQFEVSIRGWLASSPVWNNWQQMWNCKPIGMTARAVA